MLEIYAIFCGETIVGELFFHIEMAQEQALLYNGEVRTLQINGQSLALLSMQMFGQVDSPLQLGEMINLEEPTQLVCPMDAASIDPWDTEFPQISPYIP